MEELTLKCCKDSEDKMYVSTTGSAPTKGLHILVEQSGEECAVVLDKYSVIELAEYLIAYFDEE